MCGLLAWIHPRSCAEGLTPGLESLHQRGPDQQGRWSLDGVSLGHTRLQITGQDERPQPLFSEDKTIVAIVNGEFYGFEDIKKDLQQKGHTFSGDSDSEILIHLYEEYQEECLHHLRGEFAFILWDTNTQKLWAVRDRFGIKPLVWSQSSDGLFIGSKAKALFAMGVARYWNVKALGHVASHQYTIGSETLFENIQTLRPGHSLQWHIHQGQAGSPVERRWWTAPFVCPENAIPLSPQELLEHLRQSVALRMNTSQKVAVHLSGGLDSALILALAAQSGPLTAWTAGFDEAHWDETALAQEAAHLYGIRHHALHFSKIDLLKTLDAASFAGEGMSINGHLCAKWLLNQAIAQDGNRVLLTGEGADELFLGYPHYREDLFLLQGHTEALERMRHSDAHLKGVFLSQTADSSSKPAWLKAKMGFGQHLSTFLPSIPSEDTTLKILQLLPRQDHLHKVDQSAHAWLEPGLCGYILQTLGDGQEMAHSLEGRPPFLDHHLATHALKTPIHLRIQGEEEKSILREAARGLLPESIRTKRKHPFFAPPLILSPDTEVWVRERLYDPHFAKNSPVCRKRLQRAFETAKKLPPSQQQGMEPAMFAAFTLEALGRTLNVGMP